MKDPRDTNSPDCGVLLTWFGCALYTSAEKCPLRHAPEYDAANCATSSILSVLPLTITTLAPCTSAWIKRSPPVMYFLTSSSFCDASRPPSATTPSLVTNDRNRWYHSFFIEKL